MTRFALPALVLAGLLVLLGVGLTLDPRVVPSPLIDRPAPTFALAALAPGGRVWTQQDLHGTPVVVNFWASWCAPCLQEHPLLLEQSAAGVKIIGVNYKDAPADAQRWLQRHGNPFAQVLRDSEGRMGLDWGVYGVPETYVLDAQGVIRYKHVGPLDRDAWQHEIVPRLRAAT